MTASACPRSAAMWSRVRPDEASRASVRLSPWQCSSTSWGGVARWGAHAGGLKQALAAAVPLRKPGGVEARRWSDVAQGFAGFVESSRRWWG